MDKHKVSYVVKDIDKETWKRFRGMSLLGGFNSAGECILSLIEKFVNKNDK